VWPIHPILKTYLYNEHTALKGHLEALQFAKPTLRQKRIQKGGPAPAALSTGDDSGARDPRNTCQGQHSAHNEEYDDNTDEDGYAGEEDVEDSEKNGARGAEADEDDSTEDELPERMVTKKLASKVRIFSPPLAPIFIYPLTGN